MEYDYKQAFKVVPEARQAAENPNTTVEEIEFHMRRLYFFPVINIEIVRIYNRLERQLKILTQYTDKESNLF